MAQKRRICPYCGKPESKKKLHRNYLEKNILLANIYPIEIRLCCEKMLVPKAMIEENEALKKQKILV
jgi:hypothetical protein